MSGTPLISVLMPVYNAQRYLAEAVESILGQTMGDFELIAVDDGSTDRSGEMLRGYARRDGRVRVVSRGNTGIVGALNDGLTVARGEFLARMDADDVALPARLERQARHLGVHADCVAVGCGVVRVCPAGIPFKAIENSTDHGEIERRLLRGDGHALVHPAVTMRADAVRAVGAYREKYKYVEDLDLFLRLARVGRLANLPEVLMRYREHLGSINHSKRDVQSKLRERVIAEAQAERGMIGQETVVLTQLPPTRPSDQLRQWGWGALRHGSRGVALRYAARTWLSDPFSAPTYRFVACAIRGY